MPLPYLHARLGQVGAHGQPLPHHHVGVVRLLEGLLQRLQLLRREGRAAAPLLAVLGPVASLQDDVLKCAAVGKETHARQVYFHWAGARVSPPSLCVCVCVSVHSITSESLGQRERVHGGPVVGRVLRLLRGLLVQVVHGAQGVHGVQGVAVHPVVLHDGRRLHLRSTGRSASHTRVEAGGRRQEATGARRGAAWSH